jgi:hypothetical protein
VPDRLVGAELADRLAVLDDVRDDQDVVAAFGRIVCGGNRRPIQFTELPAEAQEILVGEALAAETQHQVVVPGRLHRGDRLGTKRTGEVHSRDVGGERRPGRMHRHILPFDDRRHCRRMPSAEPD